MLTLRAVSTTVAFLVVIAAACACTSSDTPPSATSSTVQSLGDVTVHRVSYDTSEGSDSTQNWGDLYLPAGEQAVDTIPLVVLIHGGSWKSQLDAQTMRPYAIDLAKRGMAVYNIEYRRVGSGGGWPNTFTDVGNALDYVVELDKQYPQLTTDDELVVGHSAGAQLAMWAGTRNKLSKSDIGHDPKFRPTRVVSLAGPLDMVYAAHHGNDRIVTALGGTPEQVPGRYASVDPVQNIDPTMPVVAIHGTADTLVPPILSERYIDEVERQNGIGDLVLADGEDHVSIVSSDRPVYGKILDIITDASGKTIDELDDLYDNN
ncbi:alpha/beta fold hydrolase [Williamsia sp. 1135]|uniref:alpha/beta hydrolase family protein n=1 Tax=Williamsia sp. 1135 TaxID=1889262 RepID=UPI000A1188BC|nr:alpha/beta fold hydrolase [Williamsia sp. 1135]ORM38133.1 alpha/beta hydrolase [Williamsia sp. 1135]